MVPLQFVLSCLLDCYLLPRDLQVSDVLLIVSIQLCLQCYLFLMSIVDFRKEVKGYKASIRRLVDDCLYMLSGISLIRQHNIQLIFCGGRIVKTRYQIYNFIKKAKSKIWKKRYFSFRNSLLINIDVSSLYLNPNKNFIIYLKKVT